MERIAVGDRVQIISVGSDERRLLHKYGMVIMIADKVNCLVVLDEGGSATVNINQLAKVG